MFSSLVVIRVVPDTGGWSLKLSLSVCPRNWRFPRFTYSTNWRQPNTASISWTILKKLDTMHALSYLCHSRCILWGLTWKILPGGSTGHIPVFHLNPTRTIPTVPKSLKKEGPQVEILMTFTGKWCEGDNHVVVIYTQRSDDLLMGNLRPCTHIESQISYITRA